MAKNAEQLISIKKCLYKETSRDYTVVVRYYGKRTHYSLFFRGSRVSGFWAESEGTPWKAVTRAYLYNRYAPSYKQVAYWNVSK